jgi:hypothetical protein
MCVWWIFILQIYTWTCTVGLHIVSIHAYNVWPGYHSKHTNTKRSQHTCWSMMVITWSMHKYVKRQQLSHAENLKSLWRLAHVTHKLTGWLVGLNLMAILICCMWRELALESQQTPYRPPAHVHACKEKNQTGPGCLEIRVSYEIETAKTRVKIRMDSTWQRGDRNKQTRPPREFPSWSRCLYKQANTSTLKKERENAARLLLFPAKHTRQSICHAPLRQRKHHRWEWLSHKKAYSFPRASFMVSQPFWHDQPYTSFRFR